MRSKGGASTNTKLTVLHFLLQDIHACIELNFIKRILPLPLLETVPGCPPYLVGLMNLAGKSIPVIDLHTRLGMQRTRPYSIDIPILLCEDGAQQTGVIVDKVLGLVDVDISELQMSDDFAKQESSYLATLPINGELSLYLNIERIAAISLTAETIDLTAKLPDLIKKTKKHHE